MVQELAKIEVLDPRSVWTHEAHDFTPWLLANAGALAEVLGIDIELTANEHPVGNFSLDLVGRDLTNDCVLIVENQLAGTDHGHLGQIVTYSAGTDAGTVVWMATSFREEHRQALDWLNGLAQGNARFFGVEIGAIRIAGSPPAPLFRLRAQPNDWHSQVATAAKASSQGEQPSLGEGGVVWQVLGSIPGTSAYRASRLDQCRNSSTPSLVVDALSVQGRPSILPGLCCWSEAPLGVVHRLPQ